MIQKIYDIILRLKSQKSPLWKILYKFARVYVSIVYPLIQKNKSEQGISDKSTIIVSLTSYPARINTVWITIASLLNQTVKPKKIVLWLSKEQFNGVESLPTQLKKLAKRGVEIRFCDGDLKPHKKYFYAMQQYPEYNILTADDDVIYPERHIENFWRKHLEFVDAVVCHTGHLITSKNGKLCNYNEWKHAVTGCTTPEILLMPVGCGGVLYPARSLPQCTFDWDMIQKVCLNVDDIWLKFMELICDTRAVRESEEEMNYFTLLSSDKNALYKINVYQNRNDIAVKNILGFYPCLEKKILKNLEMVMKNE